MRQKHYTIGELKRVIRESANEFEPVRGKNVVKDNEKNNKDAYKEMEKATKNYDGQVKNEKKDINYPQDDNRGMESLEYNNMNDTFKKKINAQKKGYVSAEAEKLHKDDPYGNAEFNDPKGMADKAKAIKKGRDVAKEIGLTASKIKEKDFENQRELAIENKVTRLKFKNTTFLTENHMLSRVPDNYKVEGKKFMMTDKANHEYLVEWHTEDKPKVTNKTHIIEEQKRIKELFNYKRNNSNTTNNMRLTEDNKVNDMLAKARKLMY